jgi:hypothetical protein
MAVIPALRRLRQVDQEFEATLGYIVKPLPQKQNKTKYSISQFLCYMNFSTIFFCVVLEFELKPGVC